MRRLSVVAFGIVVLLGISLTGARAIAAAQATPIAGTGGFVAALTVIEHPVTDTVVDLAPEGDSIGDTLAFGNPLFDEAEANEVGRSLGSCTRVEIGVVWACSWTNVLPNGALVVQGPFYDDGRDSFLAITGGTGQYAGAAGQMRLRSLGDGARFEFAFDIR